MDSAMDSFFSSDAPPAPDAGGDEGAPPPPDGEPEPEPTLEAEPPAPAAAPPAAPAAAPARPDLPEGAQSSPDGKRINIEAPRFDKIYAGHKFAEQIRQFAPTLEDAQNHYLRSNDFRHMEADFASGDPANIEEFLNFWERQSPEGFSAMTQRAIERAPAPVREQMASGFLTSKSDELYARAAETGDANDLYKARMFEWSHTGQYRTEALPKVDPLAARERSIQERETRLNQADQQRAEGQWKGWSQQTHQAIRTSLDSKIDQALGPVKDRFTDAPELFNALRDQIRLQTIQGIEADAEWLRNFNLDFRSARRTMSPGDRQALAGSYIAKADQILTAKAAPLISQATKVLVQKNQDANAQHARGADKRGSATPGAPVRRSIANGKDRSAMTMEDKIDADMAY
jgi:hypothetical protein